jgi:Ca-activated chloride channel family protein
MKIISLLFIFILSDYTFSQLNFEKVKIDFGSISSTSERFTDLKVSNKGSKKEYLLSVKKPPNVVYLVNGQFIEKDSSIIIRLQVNPQKKGRFSYEVQIYTSDKDEPTIIKLVGNLTEDLVNQANYLQACPDFNSKPQSKNATDFELSVITIDKNTKQLLEFSSVTILQNGLPKGIFTTNKKGEIKQNIPLGFTYFYVTHVNYEAKEIGAYVNFNRDKIIVELEPKKEPTLLVSKIENSVEIQNSKKVEVDSTQNIDQKLESQLTLEIKNQPKEENSNFKKLEELDPSNFEDSYFKPVNVTFVLDVSASMQAGEKMELMKFSLYQIIDMLRKQDKIAIVSYSTETKVELETTSGIEKDKIKTIVENLKAGGLTAGGSGIKLGYKQTLNSKIPEGVNQIIVITDGAFNRNSEDYKNHIEKYKKQGINMSVVGILNSEIDRKSMEKVAELGGGRYVPIHKLSDALNNLKQEIRFISFK